LGHDIASSKVEVFVDGHALRVGQTSRGNRRSWALVCREASEVVAEGAVRDN